MKFIVRITFEANIHAADLAEARREVDRWAEGIGDTEKVSVFYTEVWPAAESFPRPFQQAIQEADQIIREAQCGCDWGK